MIEGRRADDPGMGNGAVDEYLRRLDLLLGEQGPGPADDARPAPAPAPGGDARRPRLYPYGVFDRRAGSPPHPPR